MLPQSWGGIRFPPMAFSENINSLLLPDDRFCIFTGFSVKPLVMGFSTNLSKTIQSWFSDGVWLNAFKGGLCLIACQAIPSTLYGLPKLVDVFFHCADDNRNKNTSNLSAGVVSGSDSNLIFKLLFYINIKFVCYQNTVKNTPVL